MSWTNEIQNWNDSLTAQLGFAANEYSAYKLASEVGELIDIVAKLNNRKKIKTTDNTEDLTQSLADEIADVLVYLGQVATHYNIDMKKAYVKKYNQILARSFKP